MKINRDNYEAYFLDYHEGQLSPEMVEEVLLFAEQNPDLKTFLDEFEAISLVADRDIVFDKKSSLKKNHIFATSQVNELNYEEYLLNETEGLLNDDELSAIEEFISINPQFEKDRKLFALAHLSVDDEIVFEDKESLKKKVIPVGAIDAETFETFMAREIGGNLNPDEKLQLDEFILYNPQLQKDRKLYAHTILSPETDIIFEDKNSLKRTAVIPMRRLVYYALSAAASLALIFSIYFLLDRNTIPQKIAEQGKVKSTVNKVITEPIKALPENQVAVNIRQPSEITSTRKQKTDNITNAKTLNGNADKIRLQEPLALSDRNTVEPLQAKSAREITTRSYVDPQFTFIRVSQMYSNKNREFYYNLKLADELQYAQLNEKDKNPGKTILNSALEKVGDLFASNRVAQPQEEKRNFSMWTVAQLGVQTYNKITSSDVEFGLHKDDSGKVVGYNLESSRFGIDKDLNK